jgi:hypothetical protein
VTAPVPGSETTTAGVSNGSPLGIDGVRVPSFPGLLVPMAANAAFARSVDIVDHHRRGFVSRAINIICMTLQ